MLLLLLPAAITIRASAQVLPMAEMTFDKEVHDYGTIKQDSVLIT